MRNLLLLLLILLSTDFLAYGYRIRNDRRATGIVKQPRIGRRNEVNCVRMERAIGILTPPRPGRSDLPPLNYNLKKIHDVELNEDFDFDGRNDAEIFDFDRNSDAYQYRDEKVMPEENTVR